MVVVGVQDHQLVIGHQQGEGLLAAQRHCLDREALHLNGFKGLGRGLQGEVGSALHLIMS